nr:pilus assembly protein CpaE [Nocardioides flavescens]
MQAAGLRWDPAPGDAFAVPDRDLDEQVFVLSDMVIQTVDVPDGPPVLAFNGTTEWALDSLEAHEAVWLPREDQLRAVLGRSFVSLERVPGPPEGYAVTVETSRWVDVTPEAAYARAVLGVLTAGLP